MGRIFKFAFAAMLVGCSGSSSSVGNGQAEERAGTPGGSVDDPSGAGGGSGDGADPISGDGGVTNGTNSDGGADAGFDPSCKHVFGPIESGLTPQSNPYATYDKVYCATKCGAGGPVLYTYLRADQLRPKVSGCTEEIEPTTQANLRHFCCPS